MTTIIFTEAIDVNLADGIGSRRWHRPYNEFYSNCNFGCEVYSNLKGYLFEIECVIRRGICLIIILYSLLESTA